LVSGEKDNKYGPRNTDGTLQKLCHSSWSRDGMVLKPEKWQGSRNSYDDRFTK
jgi:hypothetical protein